MKIQLSKPARVKATYADQYKQEALELWRASGPFKDGWQCYEGPGIGPYWIGESAKDDAIDYAKARAKFGRGEIRVLRQDGSVESVMGVYSAC